MATGPSPNKGFDDKYNSSPRAIIKRCTSRFLCRALQIWTKWNGQNQRYGFYLAPNVVLVYVKKDKNNRDNHEILKVKQQKS